MPPQITSFEPHARQPDSFRKPRQGDLILFSQISSIRNEGRHEPLNRECNRSTIVTGRVGNIFWTPGQRVIPARQMVQLEETQKMKTANLATAAMLSLGVGSSYADNGEDAGNVANTLFTALPGVITTAPGQRPNGVVAANPQSGSRGVAAFFNALITAVRTGL
jgi:hypothetical protein